MCAMRSMLIWALRRGQSKEMIRQIADSSSRLEKFNVVWQDAVENVPFYAEWKAKHGLPDRIADLKELASWPILEKKDLILNREKLIRKDVTKFHESVTGGATGEPLHFRTMAGESDAVTTNKWIGWARMEIYPDSRMFLLWGHRHFYGQGWRSNLKFKIRQIKDWLTNHLRADATDLSPAALREDYAMMCKFKPECIVAYSASLLALVRTIRSDNLIPHPPSPIPSLRAVICTAGPLTKEERDEIGSFFGVPVGMEYGSMEAGVMAYQTPMTGGRYEVFGRTHVLQTIPETVTGNELVLVTKLTKGYLPLIRYKVGDYVRGTELDKNGCAISFAEVYGRSGDEVDMGNGVKFHGQSFMTCAEGFDKIVAYQIRVNRAKGRVVFVAQTLASLTGEEKTEIIKRAAHMSGLAVSVISVDESKALVKAPSGKIRLVVEEG